jgi:hypothetical protein
MKECCGVVESIAGPKTLCVSVKLNENLYPRYVLINNVIPRDAMACQQWLEKNVMGHNVYFFPIRTNRIGQYVADVECEGFDVGQELIKQGLAD